MPSSDSKNPMMSLMKNSAKKTADSASQARNNYQQTMAKAKEEKEKKDKEDLDEAKKNAKAKMAGGNSPELIRAKFIQASIKYSLIIFLVAILGYGIVKAVPRLLGAAGDAIYDSMRR